MMVIEDDKDLVVCPKCLRVPAFTGGVVHSLYLAAQDM